MTGESITRNDLLAINPDALRSEFDKTLALATIRTPEDFLALDHSWLTYLMQAAEHRDLALAEEFNTGYGIACAKSEQGRPDPSLQDEEVCYF